MNEAPQATEIKSSRDLVGYFVDEAKRVHGHSPPRRVVGQMAKEIGTLAKERIDVDILRAAIDVIVQKGLDPSALASASFTAQSKLPRGTTYAEMRALDEFRADLQEKYGISWPTGSRLVRGTHGITYVPDPLGCDQPEYVVHWGRPTRSEVLKALRERAKGQQ